MRSSAGGSFRRTRGPSRCAESQSLDRVVTWARAGPPAEKERWKLTSAMMEFAWKSLLALEPAERERRLEAIRRQHRLSNEAIAAALK